ncbi:MAG: hypothetical protein AB7P17_00445 [Nitrospirales bacterium]|nr:DUF4398 domain-containing protein [Nitrospirales bacterium]
MDDISTIIRTGTLVIVCGSLIWGCAEKPAQVTDQALQAIQAAKEAGAMEYAPEELRLAEDEYQKAQEEITTQDNTFVLTRNYDGAKVILTKVVTDAEQAKIKAVTNKQQAKTGAEASMALAKSMLEEAKNRLVQAPRGKGTQADLQALHGDLQAAETTFAEIEPLLAKEDFLGVKAKAESVLALATRVNDQVAHAMQKAGKVKA